MDIKIKIRPEIAKGAVRERLFKEDFIVPRGWHVHSFSYKQPRGENTAVSLKVHVKNNEGEIQTVQCDFSFAISNVDKVMMILRDKAAFEVKSEIINDSPAEDITIDDVTSKYDYLKIVSIRYTKPIEVSKTGRLDLDVEIDGVVYPYSQIIKFARSKYRDVFDRLQPSMFSVKVNIGATGEFEIGEVLNMTGSDSIKVYDAEILGLNDSRTFDVLIYISGASRNKTLVIKSDPLDSSTSFEALLDNIIEYETELAGAPRALGVDELIKNRPTWLKINSIDFANKDDITTNVGQYVVEFEIIDQIITRTCEVKFDNGKDLEIMNVITADNLIVGEAYTLKPELTIPNSALSLYFTGTASEVATDNFAIESIEIANKKINPSAKFIEYDFTSHIGGVKKVFRKNVEFQYSLNEFEINNFRETNNFVSKFPSIILSTEALRKDARQFISDPSLKKIELFKELKSKDIKEIVTVPTKLNIKLVKLDLLRFDTKSRGSIQVETTWEVKGEKNPLKKTQSLADKKAEVIILDTVDSTEVNLKNELLLEGVRPNYFSKAQFRVPAGIELINLEADLDQDKLNLAYLKFTVQIGEEIKVLDKTLTFAKADVAVSKETPAETHDNRKYLDTVDLSQLTVFVEIDKEPPYEITPSMFGGLPEDTRISVDYSWPKAGTSDVDLSIKMIKGKAQKKLSVPITFETPLSKETLKAYKARRKEERKGLNGK